ncbi:MAG: IS21 family transposase [Myxococcota bacterium]
MRKLKEILRLKYHGGIGHRQIAQVLGVSVGTVGSVSVRAQKLGLTDWSVLGPMDEATLQQRFYGRRVVGSAKAALPDPVHLHHELKKAGVTLELLHLEYLQNHPLGYSYTSFCLHYRRWRQSAPLSMRQVHPAGEKLFSDYSGKKPHIVDAITGEVVEVELFVACLGASNYTYAEATLSQKSHDWVMSHVRALEFMGGVSQLIIPDQLRSAVSQPCRYEPGVHRTFEEMAYHYGTVVLPARPYKPKDKAKAEVAVQIVQRWILARLRHEVFFSLSELNGRIQELLKSLNRRPMKGYGGQSRRELFESLDQPVLKPLPEHRYTYAHWKRAKVNIDYHVEYAKHFYSVPYRYAREEVELRATDTTVEAFHRGKRVASHVRNNTPGRFTTNPEHMPKSHQHHAQWTPSRLIAWAGSVGESTQKLVTCILERRSHPEQGYRSVLGVMSLRKAYGEDRLEAACKRALRIGGFSTRQVKSILKSGLDKIELSQTQNHQPQQTILPLEHENIRGPDYYH